MATTYCTRSDIETLLSPVALIECIDDDHSGTESAAETIHITNAIERAATRLNMAVSRQYVLSEVTGNAWMKWANATLAAELLASRRGNPAPQSIMDDAKEILELLNEISWGRKPLPEQAPSFDHLPTVSNFEAEPRKRIMPVRVVKEESTGSDPEGQRMRHYANQWGNY